MVNRAIRQLLTACILCLLLSFEQAVSAAPFAYIPNLDGANVSVIDTANNIMTANIPVGLNPYGVATSPTTGRVYITNRGDHTVSVIDSASKTVRVTIPVGLAPTGVAVSPDEKKVYVASMAGHNVSVIDTATNSVIATIPVAYAAGVAITPDNSKVFVTNSHSTNTVRVIETAGNTEIATITVGNRPTGIAITPDGTKAYVGNHDSGTISVINTVDHSIIATITAEADLFGIAVSPDGAKVYASSYTRHKVYVISTASNTLTKTIDCSDEPFGISFTPDGSKAYIAMGPAKTVIVLDSATDSITSSIPVGSSPYAFGSAISAFVPATSGLSIPFRDEFNSGLRPEWQITNPNPSTITPQATSLRLTTTATDLAGTTDNLQNLLTLQLPPDTGNIAVTAKFSFPVQPGADGQQVGVVLLRPDPDNPNLPSMENYFRAMYTYQDVLAFSYTRDIWNTENAPNNLIATTTIAAGTPFWIRVTKTWKEAEQYVYTASYSTDGVNFANYISGEQPFSFTHVGIFALHGSGSTPLDFDVDYVEVTPLTQPGTMPVGLVSWWAADNNPNDALGLNHATLVGSPSYATGIVNQAFSFDGTSQYARVGAPLNLPVGGAPRTVSLWFKTPRDLLSNTESALIQYGSVSAGNMFGLITSGNAPGKLYFYGHSADISGLTTLEPNTWYHAAAVYDGDMGRLYLNGTQDGEAQLVLNTVLDANGLTIGYRDPGSMWEGQIEDVAIFDRALNATEIQSVMNVTRDITPDYLNFSQVTDAVLSTLYESNAVTISNINMPADIAIINGEYAVSTDDGASWSSWTTTAGTVSNGTQVKLRQTSSNTGGTTTSVELFVGTMSGQFWVTTALTPATVTTASIIGSAITSVTAGGTVVAAGDAPVTERGICWGTSFNPAVGGTCTILGSGSGTFSTIISGLALNSTYYVRAYAISAAGTAYGANIQFTTATPTGPFAYVTNQLDNTVSVIDTTTHRVVSTITTGDGPRGVALHGSLVYLANSYEGSVSVIDAASNTTVGTPIPVGVTPNNLAINPTGTKLYMGDSNAQSVYTVDTASKTVGADAVTVNNPWGLIVHPSGNPLYVVSSIDNVAWIINTTTGAIYNNVPVGSRPRGVAVTPDGGVLYVANGDSNNVTAINTGTYAVTTIPVGTGPRGVAVSPDGSKVYVTNQDSNSVSVISTSDNSILTTITVQSGPYGIAINPSGTHAYAVNRISGTVSVIDTATDTVVQTITVGSSPYVLGQFIGTFTTTAADTTPDPFTFTDHIHVGLNNLSISNAITVSGINAPTAISISGGEYQINGGNWTNVIGTVSNGNTVAVRQTSSASGGVTTDVVLTVGGVSDTFSVTTIVQHAVNFTSGTNGSITGATSQTVTAGGSTTAVTAVPDTGYHFVNWTGTGGFVTSITNPLIVTNVTADLAITAHFAITTYTVTPSAGSGGSISPSTVQIINYGSPAQFTITPDSDYRIASVNGSCGGSLSGNIYTTNPISAHCTVTAVFAASNEFVDSFNPNADNLVTAVAIQPDGKVLVGGLFTAMGGETRNRIARLNTDGSADLAFNPDADGGVSTLAIQPDGKILAVGDFTTISGVPRNRIARLNADGTIDPAFNPGADAGIYRLVLQQDGKILVGGVFTTLGGQAKASLARLQSDGSLDATFNLDPRLFVGTNPSLAMQPDGKIIVGGVVKEIDPINPTAPAIDTYSRGIVRLNGDGSWDTTYAPELVFTPPGSRYDAEVQAIVVQPDGKLLIGGLFTSINSQVRNYFGRLNRDGTTDTAFSPLLNSLVNSIALRADGKIIIVGGFSLVNGTTRSAIARLNSDGSTDESFNLGTPSLVKTIALQGDGKMIIGGLFSTFGGQTRGSIARIIPVEPALQIFTAADDGSAVIWQRGGSAPEIHDVIFEYSPDQITWTSLGQANRISNGWQLTNPLLPTNVSLTIRAQGKESSCDSTTLITAVLPFLNTGIYNYHSITPSVGAGLGSITPNTPQSVIHGVGKLFTVIPGNGYSLTGVTGSCGGTLSGNTYDTNPVTADCTVVANFAVTSYTVSPSAGPGGTITPGTAQTTPPGGAVQLILVPDPGYKIVSVTGSCGGILNGATYTTTAVTADCSVHATFEFIFDPFAPDTDGPVRTIVVQTDGKIIIGGTFTTVNGQARGNLARLNPDGTLDVSFNPQVNNDVNAMILQQDGKIIIGGTFTYIGVTAKQRIARLNSDGTIDNSFIASASHSVTALALQPNGMILMGGRFENYGGAALVRLLPDGAQDTFFISPSMSLNTPPVISSIVVLKDEKILVAGDFDAGSNRYVSLMRLNPDGSADETFKSDRTGSIPYINIQGAVSAVVELPDRKILLAGTVTAINGQAKSRVARLLADGTPDNTFTPDVNGMVSTLSRQPNGQILIGGDFTTVNGVIRNRLARLNADGTLDNAFNPEANNTVLTTNLQINGKLYVGGSFSAVGGQTRNRIARLNFDVKTFSVTPSATAGGSISPNSVQTLYQGAIHTFTMTPVSGYYLASVSGSCGGYIDGTTYTTDPINADCSVIANFAQGAPLLDGLNPDANNQVNAIVVQTDGKVIVGGSFTSFGGQTRNRLARLNADGTLDSTFNPNADGSIYALALQPDGKILVGGYFNSIAGQNRNLIVRLNNDGSLDSSFAPFAVPGVVYAIALQSNGMILVGGDFTYESSVPSSDLFRLHADGTPDKLFNRPSFNLGYPAVVSALAVLPDDRIIVGGDFISASYPPAHNLIMLQPHGPIISTLEYNEKVRAIAVQPDGKILLGGHFTKIGTASRNHIARLDTNMWPDASFTPDVNYTVYALAYQPNGQVIAAGDFTMANGLTRKRIARFNADGSLDEQFNPGANYTVHALAVSTNGKIFAGGAFTSFGGAARNRFAQVNFAATTCSVTPIISPSGTIAPTAAKTVNQGESVSFTITPHTGYYTAGVGGTCGGILRGTTYTTRPITADCTVAPVFSQGEAVVDGISADVDGQVRAFAVQSDGKIIVGGRFSFIGGKPIPNLARLNPNGTADTSFAMDVYGVDHPLVVRPAVAVMATQSDGKIIVGGTFYEIGGQPRKSIARLNANGTLDATFIPDPQLSAPYDPGVSASINAVAIQPDGKILIGGFFTVIGGQARTNIARLNRDGTLDSTFNISDLIIDTDVTALLVQSDGKILVGTKNVIGIGSRNRITRLNADGSKDSSFTIYLDGSVSSIVLQADGMIILGGNFPGISRNVTRLDQYGSRDLTFETLGDGAVQTISPLANGKFLVGGDFTSLDGQTRNRIARLNADGTLDNAFNPDANGSVYALMVQPNGKVLVGGEFTVIGGQEKKHFARINAAEAAPGTHTGVVVSDSSKPTVADALAVLKFIVGTTQLTIDQQMRADVAPAGANGLPQGNGIIDDADVLMLLRRSIDADTW